MSQMGRAIQAARNGRMTIFEQVVLCNSLVILISAVLAYWVTHVVVEPYHELIDTSFIVVATLLGVAINAYVLRRAFQPLFAMLATIGAIGRGDRRQRVPTTATTNDLAQIADAFNGMLDALEQERQMRLRAVTEAQEAERRRIALELHDATGQELTALLLRLEVLAQDLRESSGDHLAAERQVAQTAALAERTLRGVQRLAQQLRPTVLDDLGLAAALHWLADELQPGEISRIQVTLAPLPALAPLTESMLFRIAQEALANAVRHSNATHITLTLTCVADALHLIITDDGHGFDPLRTTYGLGLVSMRERAELLGGAVQIDDATTGVRIHACIPFAAEVACD